MTRPGRDAWRRVASLGGPHPGSQRIVLVLHSSLAVQGGAEEVTRQLAAAWRCAGHRVTVLSYDDLPRWVHPRLKRSVLPWFLTGWLICGKAWRHVDVLDCSTGDAWLAGSLTQGRRSWLLITRSHGLEPLGERAHQAELRERGARPSSLRQLYFAHWMQAEVRRSLRVSDIVRVLSEAERRYCLEELRLVPARVRLRPNGFPDELLAHPIPDATTPLRLASIGRWERLKGCNELRIVLGDCLRALPEATAVLLGTGVSQGDLRSTMPSDVRDRIEIVSTYAPESVGELLAGAHVYLSLSHTEGFSLGLVEAMARGLVPVVTDVGAAPELVADAIGTVVQVGDTTAATTAVLALADDRTGLRRRGQAARGAVEAYRWSTVAAEDLRGL